jgi:hypothetical protein
MFKSRRLKSRRLKSRRLKSRRLKSRRLKSRRLKSRRLKSRRLKSKKYDSFSGISFKNLYEQVKNKFGTGYEQVKNKIINISPRFMFKETKKRLAQEKEKQEKEKQEKEKQEKQEKEKQEKEKQEKEKQEKEKQEKEKQEKEKQEEALRKDMLLNQEKSKRLKEEEDKKQLENLVEIVYEELKNKYPNISYEQLVDYTMQMLKIYYNKENIIRNKLSKLIKESKKSINIDIINNDILNNEFEYECYKLFNYYNIDCKEKNNEIGKKLINADPKLISAVKKCKNLSDTDLCENIKNKIKKEQQIPIVDNKNLGDLLDSEEFINLSKIQEQPTTKRKSNKLTRKAIFNRIKKFGNKSSIPKEKVLSNDDLFRNWKGHIFTKNKGLIYLLEKYKDTGNICVNTQDIKYLELIKIGDKFQNNDKLWKYINDVCLDKRKKTPKPKRFILIPMSLREKNNGNGHFNFIIYDTKRKELERFEPNGAIGIFPEYGASLDDDLFNLFKEKTGEKNVKYFEPAKFLPNICFQSSQAFEDDAREDIGLQGTCVLWSIWYADLRLSNPDTDREKLVNETWSKIKADEISLTKFITDYGHYIDILPEYNWLSDSE